MTSTSLFHGYSPLPQTYDEMFLSSGAPRPAGASTVRLIDQMGEKELKSRQRAASTALLTGGITFSVYSDNRGTERIFPFDVIPRLVEAAHWDPVERGLVQRIRALNLFLADIYGPQRILKEGRIPPHLVNSSSGFLPQLRGIRPPHDVYVVVAGIDLVRDETGRFLVLEDNLRTPSGVSYVLENRGISKRVLGPVLSKLRVRTVDIYPLQLRDALRHLAPEGTERPNIVVLTPGIYNSAYFEHSFLARRMGCDLVCPSDLFVHEDRVYVKTTSGPQRVHVIYRRVDDEFMDPQVFRSDSLLGVPGIVRAYAAGKVTLANAFGNGVADDKATYAFVPEMIRFYLSEEPILGQVDTLLCEREEDRKRVLAELDRMVVKQVDGSGGYGMLVGPKATAKERSEFAGRIREAPRKFIAQPLVELSTCPTWTGKGIAPRRVDLRPYIITAHSPWVLPGGLTRVALTEGSYVVNSSQGGGSKDTWVLEGGAR